MQPNPGDIYVIPATEKNYEIINLDAMQNLQEVFKFCRLQNL